MVTVRVITNLGEIEYCALNTPLPMTTTLYYERTFGSGSGSRKARGVFEHFREFTYLERQAERL